MFDKNLLESLEICLENGQTKMKMTFREKVQAAAGTKLTMRKFPFKRTATYESGSGSNVLLFGFNVPKLAVGRKLSSDKLGSVSIEVAEGDISV